MIWNVRLKVLFYQKKKIFQYLLNIIYNKKKHNSKMILCFLWIDNYLLGFEIFFKLFIMLPKNLKGKPQLLIGYYLSGSFCWKNISKAKKNLKTMGSRSHLLIWTDQNYMAFSINQTLLQLILMQLFLTLFEN